MWLRDFLPGDVPNARVLLYGYDTNLTSVTWKKSIHDLAMMFLEAVKAVRGDRDVSLLDDLNSWNLGLYS